MTQRYVIYLLCKATGLEIDNVADLGAVVEVACRYGTVTIYTIKEWSTLPTGGVNIDYLTADKAAEELQQLHQQD